MNDRLAELLLFKKVLQWDEEEISKERPFLQAAAAFKYDKYQQFAPGMKFIESLALWLKQFSDIKERRIAYNFVKNRLIFVSDEEMMHLVSIAYPDYIKPILIRKTAAEIGAPKSDIGRIVKSPEFEILKLQSLFLGLSDGARIDTFRRFNKELSHEQIWPIYDISSRKAFKMKEKLRERLSNRLPAKELEEKCRFKTIFLLDDFSGSGISYLRMEENGYTGKIFEFCRKFGQDDNLREFVFDEATIYVILYIATEQARKYLREMVSKLSIHNWTYNIEVIQLINDEYKVSRNIDQEFIKNLVDRDEYYDKKVEDEHTGLGGTLDLRFGFAGCSLPLVLHHNTPNNSIALLWSYDYEECKIRGLFPRVRRHEAER